MKKIYVIVPLIEANQILVDIFLKNNNFLLDYKNVEIVFKCSNSALKSKNKSVKILIIKDNSIYQAWNQAIEYINKFDHSYKYFIFLGYDDVINENFFIKANKEINNNFDIIYGNYLIDTTHKKKIFKKSNPSSSIFKNLPKKKWDICHAGIFMNGNLFKNLTFHEEYKLGGDIEFFIKSTQQKTLNACYIDEIQITINLLGISNSFSAKLTYLDEIKKMEDQYNVKVIGYSKIIELLKFVILKSIIGKYLRKIWWIYFK